MRAPPGRRTRVPCLRAGSGRTAQDGAWYRASALQTSRPVPAREVLTVRVVHADFLAVQPVLILRLCVGILRALVHLARERHLGAAFYGLERIEKQPFILCSIMSRSACIPPVPARPSSPTPSIRGAARNSSTGRTHADGALCGRKATYSRGRASCPWCIGCRGARAKPCARAR